MEKLETTFVVPSWYYWNNPVKQQPLTQLYLATVIEQFTNANIDLTDLRENPNIEIPKKDLGYIINVQLGYQFKKEGYYFLHFNLIGSAKTLKIPLKISSNFPPQEYEHIHQVNGHL